MIDWWLLPCACRNQDNRRLALAIAMRRSEGVGNRPPYGRWIRSLRVLVRGVGFGWSQREALTDNPVLPGCPSAKVDQFAPLGTEGPRTIVLPGNRGLANRAGHGDRL